jgi:hypothetical protein
LFRVAAREVGAAAIVLGLLFLLALLLVVHNRGI